MAGWVGAKPQSLRKRSDDAKQWGSRVRCPKALRSIRNLVIHAVLLGKGSVTAVFDAPKEKAGLTPGRRVCDGDHSHLRQWVLSAAGAKDVCYRDTVYLFHASSPFGRRFDADQRPAAHTH